MNALVLLDEQVNFDEQVSFRRHHSPRSQRDVTSKSKWTSDARYRRRPNKNADSFTGSHRRRQKRNYL